MNEETFYYKRLSLINDIYDLKKALYSMEKKIKVLDTEVDAEARLQRYLTDKLPKVTTYMDNVLSDVRKIYTKI